MTFAAWVTWSRAAFTAVVKLHRSGSVAAVWAASEIAVLISWQVLSKA
ncbi:hypothetical protein ACWF95_39510 [Streptomyces vinaceus]